ncbi:hypothetical protein [Acetobacterium wieringae]|uniref:hypothetical protein n=1 Tax=Acetobacterium wieringae TaxID=52694 RepID=UPI0026E9596C|nr:hypothetical protein [Acetobacterium wieringae]
MINQKIQYSNNPPINPDKIPQTSNYWDSSIRTQISDNLNLHSTEEGIFEEGTYNVTL